VIPGRCVELSQQHENSRIGSLDSWAPWTRHGSLIAQGEVNTGFCAIQHTEEEMLNLDWQHHGVDKMFWLEAGPLSATTTNIVYLCRPLIKWVKIVACDYSCYMVPRRRPSWVLRACRWSYFRAINRLYEYRI
jgi:hypothetical protein